MKYNREIKNQDIYFTKYISKSVKMRKRKINKSVIFILFSMIILITHVIYFCSAYMQVLLDQNFILRLLYRLLYKNSSFYSRLQIIIWLDFCMIIAMEL